MFIILNRDDWFGLEVILNCYGKPKQFRSEDEAIRYINTRLINTVNAEVVNVHI